MSIDGGKTIITPEQVSVTYQTAGLGTRFVAILLDTLIQAALFFIIGLMWALAWPAFDFDETIGALERDLSGWIIALFILFFFAILWGYFIFWETLLNGQTPGKRATGIRVLCDSGKPVDFRAVFVRNICRYIDFLPFLYGVGVMSMFLSKDSKRLGDYAAGTVVVMDATPAPSLIEEAPTVTQYRLLEDPSRYNLRAVSRDQFRIVEHFLARRFDLADDVRGELSRDIAVPLFDLIGMPIPTGKTYPYEEFLVEFATAYRNRSVS